jgi:hypothetical protein
MKKIIILLMAVSIMLTSCGKSAGLLNSNKKTDNKTLSASTLKKLSQGTNYKNSSKKSSADTIKEYWHTTSDFFSTRKIGLIVTVVSLIALGSAYYYFAIYKLSLMTSSIINYAWLGVLF